LSTRRTIGTTGVYQRMWEGRTCARPPAPAGSRPVPGGPGWGRSRGVESAGRAKLVRVGREHRNPCCGGSFRDSLGRPEQLEGTKSMKKLLISLFALALVACGYSEDE